MPDQPLDPRVHVAHDLACSRGEPGYADPVTGLFVFTRDHHLARGSCCGSRCRHCPFDHIAVDANAAGKGARNAPRKLS